MGADQIAELRPAIVEVLEGARSGETWCATFTEAGDPERWIQLTADTVNLAYPHQDEPTARLAALSPAASLQLDEWNAGRHATFRFDAALTPLALAQLVDLLFRGILGCDDDYSVDVEMAPLP